jgi:hypothetical protein
VLDNETRCEVDKHLVDCGRCAGELKRFERTVALIKSRCVPQPPELYWTRLRATVRSRLEHENTRLFHGVFDFFMRPRAVTGAVGVVVATALVWILWEGARPMERGEISRPPLLVSNRPASTPGAQLNARRFSGYHPHELAGGDIILVEQDAAGILDDYILQTASAPSIDGHAGGVDYALERGWYGEPAGGYTEVY